MADCELECYNISFYREDHMDSFSYELNEFLLFVDVSIDYKYIDKFISDINIHYERAKTEDIVVVAVDDPDFFVEPKFTLIRYRNEDILDIFKYAKTLNNINLSIILDSEHVHNDTIKLVHNLYYDSDVPSDIILKIIDHRGDCSLNEKGIKHCIVSYRCKTDCFISHNISYVCSEEHLYIKLQQLENNTVVEMAD